MGNFTDYRAAFDSLRHDFMQETLEFFGIHPKLRAIIAASYRVANAQIKLYTTEGEIRGETFAIGRGVLQGALGSAKYFIMAIHLKFLKYGLYEGGVDVVFPTPRGAREYACTLRFNNGLYADDAHHFCKGEEESQTIFDKLENAKKPTGMEVRVDKCESLPIQRKQVRLGRTTDEDIAAMGWPKSAACVNCGTQYPGTRSLEMHLSHGCTEQMPKPPKSRNGQLADKLVRAEKRRHLYDDYYSPNVGGIRVPVVADAKCLGYYVAGDGTQTKEISSRKGKATGALKKWYPVLKEKQIGTVQRLHGLAATVGTALATNCEVAKTDKVYWSKIGGALMPSVAAVVGHYSDELRADAKDLMRCKITAQRNGYLGDILRKEETNETRMALIASAISSANPRTGWKYKTGTLLEIFNGIAISTLIAEARLESEWERTHVYPWKLAARKALARIAAAKKEPD